MSTFKNWDALDGWVLCHDLEVIQYESTTWFEEKDTWNQERSALINKVEQQEITGWQDEERKSKEKAWDRLFHNYIFLTFYFFFIIEVCLT